MAVLIMTPLMSAETGEGAAGCASGSQACSGIMPAFAPKPKKASRKAAVGEQDEGHAGEEHVVLEVDEREAAGSLLPEVARRVYGDAGRDRAEQHQEEPGEWIDPEMERQVGQPERQGQRLRGQPYRLK